MRPARHLAGILVVGAALALSSCGESSLTGVVSQPPDTAELRRGGHFGNLTLLSCSPLAADTTIQSIGPDGGTILAGPHRFSVPAGALDEVVTITMIVPSDTINRVRFLPEGLEFEDRAILEMSYANCSPLLWFIPRRVVYIDDGLTVLEVLLSITNIFDRTVVARLDHFSDYAVAW